MCSSILVLTLSLNYCIPFYFCSIAGLISIAKFNFLVILLILSCKEFTGGGGGENNLKIYQFINNPLINNRFDNEICIQNDQVFFYVSK